MKISWKYSNVFFAFNITTFLLFVIKMTSIDYFLSFSSEFLATTFS